jgi:hypothetical protein
MWVGLIVALAAPSVEAGGPPQRGPRGGFPGRGGQFGPFMGRRQNADPFDVARLYFTLTDEQQAGLGKLEAHSDTEERAGLVELRKKLDAKFVPLIVAALPEADRAKFEKVFAAMAERDAAIAAAENELWEALNKLRADQSVTGAEPNTLPFGKTEIIRRYLKLTDDQRKAVDETARASFDNLREAMKDIPRPQNMGDEAARREFFEAARKVREKADADASDVMAAQLPDELRKAYQAVAAVYDATQKKIGDAEQACAKKLAELGAVAKPPAPAPGANPAEQPKAGF